MVIERQWKRWVYFYIPLTIFIIGTLFPFYWMLITAIRPDAELYRSWRAANNTPFWTLQPTLDHFRDLMAKTNFPKWLWNTFFIACVFWTSASRAVWASATTPVEMCAVSGSAATSPVADTVTVRAGSPA